MLIRVALANGTQLWGNMPNLAEHLGTIVDGLLKVHDTSDTSAGLLNALRALQPKADVTIPPGIDPNNALLTHICGLWKAGQIDRDLMLDIGNALGGIIPSPGPYEIDAGWLESVVNYWKNLDSPSNFPTHIAKGISGVDDLVSEQEIRIALVGDWGVDPEKLAVAARVTSAIAKYKPHYTIHLGDTYYSGLDNEERTNVLGTAGPGGPDLWPKDTISYALNSNHEMYAGGHGFFSALLVDPRFTKQQGLSYFALQNQHWLVIGLDTAYFGRWKSLLYQKGTLAEPRDNSGTVQREWLYALLNDRRHAGKRVLLLTHHDGFDINPGSRAVTKSTLYDEVKAAMGAPSDPALLGHSAGPQDWWWYWGHVHAPVVYQRILYDGASSISPRCAGHGAIPFLPYPANYAELGDGTFEIAWAETKRANADGDVKRALNGFALITLTGPTIEERFYDENGYCRWSSV